MSVMRSASQTSSRSYSAKLLVALLGVLLTLLAAVFPYVPRSPAHLLAHGDLAYDVELRDPAVLPTLKRDQRQRAHLTLPPTGEEPGMAVDLVLFPGTTAGSTLRLPESFSSRFHHLDERTSAPRAPPTLV